MQLPRKGYDLFCIIAVSFMAVLIILRKYDQLSEVHIRSILYIIYIFAIPYSILYRKLASDIYTIFSGIIGRITIFLVAINLAFIITPIVYDGFFKPGGYIFEYSLVFVVNLYLLPEVVALVLKRIGA